MKLSLVVAEGVHKGKAIPIPVAQFVIGRDEGCQLRPSSPAVSKKHCAIEVKGGKVFVQDFGSTNGTFVNDEPVTGETEVTDGDKLVVRPRSCRRSKRRRPNRLRNQNRRRPRSRPTTSRSSLPPCCWGRTTARPSRCRRRTSRKAPRCSTSRRSAGKRPTPTSRASRRRARGMRPTRFCGNTCGAPARNIVFGGKPKAPSACR